MRSVFVIFGNKKETLPSAFGSLFQGLRGLRAHFSSPFLTGQKGWKKPPACPHALSF